MVQNFDMIGNWSGGDAQNHCFRCSDYNLVVQKNMCVGVVFTEDQASGVDKNATIYDNAIVSLEGGKMLRELE